MQPPMSRRNKLALVIFCVAAPFVYVHVTQGFRDVKIPMLMGFIHGSIFLANTLVVAREILGTASAAVILAAPLAWLIRGRPLFLALCLSIATAIFTLVPDVWLDSMLSNYSFSLRELSVQVIFYFFCWVVAIVVNRFIKRRNKKLSELVGPPPIT